MGGSGKAGGFDGGAMDVDGNGPVKGKTKSVNNAQGGGAAFGGQGKDLDFSYSQTYATPELANHLIGGSGGGGGDTYGGGAGGGAVELFAHGDGALTITSGGKILANGGDTSTNHAQSGGGGSGGAIRLEGGSISIAGTLEAKGGNGLTALLVGVAASPSRPMATLPWEQLSWTGTVRAPCIFPGPLQPLPSPTPVVPLPSIRLTGTGHTAVAPMVWV